MNTFYRSSGEILERKKKKEKKLEKYCQIEQFLTLNIYFFFSNTQDIINSDTPSLARYLQEIQVVGS